MMRAAGDSGDGVGLRALVVILRRAGLRIGEALDLAETDLDAARGAVLVRRGTGGRRPRLASNSRTAQRARAYDDGSRPIDFVTRTSSSWRARALR